MFIIAPVVADFRFFVLILAAVRRCGCSLLLRELQSNDTNSVGTSLISVNSSYAYSPPGNCGKFVRLICPRGKVLADFERPGGRAFAIPWATPKLFTHTWFPTQNPDITKCEGKYWKHEQTRKKLAYLSMTGKNL